MEYVIYNETLVYYALRDENGKYLSPAGQAGSLRTCRTFSSQKDAIAAQEQFPEFKHIRKVKVIDIGEV